MPHIELIANKALSPAQGILTEVLLGVVLLVLVFYVKAKLVRSTKDFVIADRKIGFGFGVAGLISIWTWAMAVMMSAAMTYQFGLSGLFWFTVPNGLAVIAIIPFARRIRSQMPNGYTISEFVSARYDGSKVASAVVTIGMLFGSIIEVIINIKGTSLVVSNVFGANPQLATLVGLGVVLVYSVLGGLWASVSTSTLTTLFITVPSAIVVTAALHQVGGAGALWSTVEAQGNGLLTVTRSDVPGAFGITLALGLLTATLAGQEFWQVVWGLKRKDVSRTFLWAGAWFYPIPICLGILGLVGLALEVDLSTLGGDAAAIGPYLISHLGLPTWIVIAYVFVILAACYSTIDGAFTAISSVFVVDIIKRIAPHIRERSLFLWTKIPMVLAAAIAAVVVLSDVDFVTIVLTTYAIRTAILVPLMLSIFWSRITVSGFVGGTLAGIAIGMPVRSSYGELWGSAAILSISAIVPLALGLLNARRFDFERLKHVTDATVSVSEQATGALVVTAQAQG
jgi:Na+/proline symporter